jgi:type I restriction enzyme S subunit
VIPTSLPEANCADLVIVRPGVDVEPQFLAAFFNSTFGKRHVSGNLVGAAQKHFNVGAAKATVLALPPRPEQRRIIAELFEVRSITSVLSRLFEQKQAALAALKRSLLHQAFNGKL